MSLAGFLIGRHTSRAEIAAETPIFHALATAETPIFYALTTAHDTPDLPGRSRRRTNRPRHAQSTPDELALSQQPTPRTTSPHWTAPSAALPPRLTNPARDTGSVAGPLASGQATGAPVAEADHRPWLNRHWRRRLPAATYLAGRRPALDGARG
jgi:hypothetical protein